MKEAHKLKGFQSQISKLEADCDVIKEELEIKKNELREKINAIFFIKSQIKKLQKTDGLKVSEHAIIRYIERVEKRNIQEIENKIANKRILELVDKFKSGEFPSGNGFSVVVKNNTVVTIK